ncbi:MAG: hypothetical protein NTW25_00410 [Candidatus Kapabacteria bacterium]|nr:hypothetical protein [Candidatus Kapabacteria bacterium]
MILDKKQYELKDHLGNVRVAIGDMKIPTAVRGQAPFVVDEKSVSDFYPGGMSISDRSWQGTSYRYGYNAQEKSLEIDASGNHHTAEFWEVNNASLRRWNRDPKPVVGISEYSIFGNNPIKFKDLLGDSVHSDEKNFKKADRELKATLGEQHPFSRNEKNGNWEINEKFDTRNYNSKQMEIYNRLKHLILSKELIYVKSIKSNFSFIYPKIINPSDGSQPYYETKIKTLDDLNASGISLINFADQPSRDFPKDILLTNLIIPENILSYKALISEESNGEITYLHELLGHIYLYITKPKLSMKDNLYLTTQMDILIRSIFKIEYTFPESLFREDKYYYLGGTNFHNEKEGIRYNDENKKNN